MSETEITAQTVYHLASIGSYDHKQAWEEAKKYPQGARFFKDETGIRVVPKDGQEVLFP